MLDPLLREEAIVSVQNVKLGAPGLPSAGVGVFD